MADKKISDLTAITGANTADDDLLVIVDTSAGETKRITLGELENGLARSNFALGDNEKITFGAGSDLQIYHNGSNSFISDAGTGDLFIRSNGGGVTFDTGGGETTAQFVNNGAVNLYYDGSKKLATTTTGIDVTGTVTADGLTVSATGGTKLLVENTDTNWAGLELKAGGNQANYIFFKDDTAERSRFTAFDSGQLTFSNGTSPVERFKIASNGDISFYEDTGTTAKLVWSSVDQILQIINDNSTVYDGTDFSTSLGGLVIQNTDTTSGTGSFLRFVSQANGTGQAAIGALNGSTAKDSELVFLTRDGSATDDPIIERMRIDSSGRVGIGTSSPNGLLETNTTGNNFTYLRSGDANTVGIIFGNQSDAATASIQMLHSDNSLSIRGYNNTERMRIDSSGNVLIGQSTASDTAAGIYLAGDGRSTINRDGNFALQLNRLTSDGEILRFRKDGTTVGSIGVNSSKAYVGTGDTGLMFDNGNNRIDPVWVTNGGSIQNGILDLGGSSSRFKDLYLSGGVYLGGTGSANYLDDYEEGAFTPVIADAASGGNTNSAAVQVGRYTKIGRTVHINISMLNIYTTGLTSGNGAYIQGLPFAVATVAYMTHVGSAKGDNVTNLDKVQAYQTHSAIGLNILVSDITHNTGDIYLDITYETA